MSRAGATARTRIVQRRRTYATWTARRSRNFEELIPLETRMDDHVGEGTCCMGASMKQGPTGNTICTCCCMGRVGQCRYGVDIATCYGQNGRCTVLQRPGRALILPTPYLNSAVAPPASMSMAAHADTFSAVTALQVRPFAH